MSAFLKHAFREVTFGFCKGTVPGAPPLSSPGPLRMPKNNSKETYLVPPKGPILVKNMRRYSQVVQRYRTRGAPFPLHKAPGMPKNTSKKTYLVPGPRAHLRQGTFEKPRKCSRECSRKCARECPQKVFLCCNPIQRLPLECSRECSRGCPRECTRSGLVVCHLV